MSDRAIGGRTVALAIVAVALAGVIAVGVVSAATAPSGRIVFASAMPVYPLPDNVGEGRTFSIAVTGRGRHEIHPSTKWISSRDGSLVYFTRDTSAGAEVWVEGADGTGTRRLAVLAGSGPVTHLVTLPGSRKLTVIAGAVWALGVDGSNVHTVFAPPAGSSVGSFEWSRDGSRLAVLAGDLWLAPADGGIATRLFATDGATVRYFSLSPDASRVLVSSRGDTWLVRTDGTPAVKLRTDGGYPDWAPDGSAFALEDISLAGCQNTYYKCAEWYLDVFDGTGARRKHLGAARAAVWSPDSRRLVVESADALYPEDGTIDVVNRDGSGRTDLTAKVKKGRFTCWRFPAWQGKARVTFDEAGCDPDFGGGGFRRVTVEVPSGRFVRSIAGGDLNRSPDGKRIAYLLYVGNDVRLYVATAAGRKRVRVSKLHGAVDEAAWSRDGQRLAFTYGTGTSEETHDEQIYVVAATGGRARQVTHEVAPSYEWDLRWTADGRRLLYSAQLIPSTNKLWTIAADGSDPRRLTDTWNDDWEPQWSRDGTRIVFTRWGQIYVIRADGKGAHRLIGTGREKDVHPVWSPDGKHIAFVRNTDKTYYIGTANADGTNVRVLRNAGSVHDRPSWSPDGDVIYADDDASKLMAIAPDGTNKHELLHVDCAGRCPKWSNPVFSPDGRRIAVGCPYCDSTSPQSIWVMQADGTDLHRVVTDAIEASWSGDGGSIVFSGHCGPPPPPKTNPVYQVCAVDSDGSNLRALTTWPFESRGPSWSKQ